jgi:hypothetical protein
MLMTIYIRSEFTSSIKKEDISKYGPLVCVNCTTFYGVVARTEKKAMSKYGLAIPHLRIAMYRSAVVIVLNVTSWSAFT